MGMNEVWRGEFEFDEVSFEKLCDAEGFKKHVVMLMQLSSQESAILLKNMVTENKPFLANMYLHRCLNCLENISSSSQLILHHSVFHHLNWGEGEESDLLFTYLFLCVRCRTRIRKHFLEISIFTSSMDEDIAHYRSPTNVGSTRENQFGEFEKLDSMDEEEEDYFEQSQSINSLNSSILTPGVSITIDTITSTTEEDEKSLESSSRSNSLQSDQSNDKTIPSDYTSPKSNSSSSTVSRGKEKKRKSLASPHVNDQFCSECAYCHDSLVEVIFLPCGHVSGE